MATLDDKILGEKLHYYCSSSESEDEDQAKNKQRDREETKKPSVKAPRFIPSSDLRQWQGETENTGPKGVIKDWQRFKQLETERREDQEKERMELIKKLSLTCRSHLDEERDKKKVGEEEEEEMDPDIDSMLLEYVQKRMQEMLQTTLAKPQFGKLVVLENANQFLDAIEKEHPETTVVIHLYTPDVPGCEAMNGCLHSLAADYPLVKFCVVSTSATGMSSHFERNGVPALLVYRKAALIGNFVRLSDEFGEDFYATDVEAFLVDHGFLPDPNTIPQVLRASSLSKDDDDDD